jgi:hypothetical protein
MAPPPLDPLNLRSTLRAVSTEQSSIQRFLQNRASQLLMGSYGRTGSAWQIGIGAICLVAGVGLLISGLLSGVKGLTFGSLGPLIAGGINLVVGLAFRKRYQQTPNEPKLTNEARGFLLNLMRQTNTGWQHHGHVHAHWQFGQAPQAQTPLANGETFFHQLGKHWGFIPKTPKDVLPKPLYDLLETSCHHYNRVHGLLEGARSDSAFAKIAQTARQGADEAIFGILHHAATMHRFPETISAASRDCEEKIRGLKELADGLESIQTRPSAISDRLGYASAMDSALEEVRLERLAREELRRVGEDEQNLRDRL